MEEIIEEKIRRKKEEFRRKRIILAIITTGLLTFISARWHPRAYSFEWYMIIVFGFAAILAMYWICSMMILGLIETNIRDDEQTAFIRNVLDTKEKKVVKNNNEKTCELIYDLQKRGKFYASFLNEKERQVHVEYRYDGEEKYISYECIYPAEFYKKYSFVDEI